MADVGDTVFWLALDGHTGNLVPLPAIVVRKLDIDELELHVFYHRDKLGAAADNRIDAKHGMKPAHWLHREEVWEGDAEQSRDICAECWWLGDHRADCSKATGA